MRSSSGSNAATAPQSKASVPADSSAGGAADSERVLATLLGNLDGMVYRCRDDANWTMEFVSDGCERVTGYAPAELLLNGRVSYEEITHPDDRTRVRTAIHAAIAERRRFDVEYRIRHADGGVRWVWERGIAVRDATDRVVALEGREFPRPS